MRALLTVLLLVSATQLAGAPERLKIGFIGVLSGPLASLGDELLDGFRLRLGEKSNLGGVSVDLIVADDQAKPDVGVQDVTKMLDRDGAQIILVGTLSNVMLAIAPKVFASKAILLSILPGASRLAGKECSPYYYNISFENDGFPETVGQYLTDKGVKRAYFMAPNYQGGKDTLVGLKRTFKGELEAVFTPLSQLDFSTELSQLKAAKPEAVYFFYPGALGIAFLKQWHEAGIHGIELLTHNAVDQTMLPAIGDSAIGLKVATQWAEDIKNPANAKFVTDFKAKYNRTPSIYAAQGYDGAQLIEAALKSLDGKVGDREALRKALGNAKFDSVRGSFKFNTNHYPIQDYYMTQVEKRADGTYHFDLRDRIFSAHGDVYAADCKMP